MRGILVVFLIALAESAIAQTPKPEPKPVVSRNITLQLNTLGEELQQIQKDFAAVDAQVRKENPGWHLAQNLQLEKDVPVTPPAPPAAKK